MAKVADFHVGRVQPVRYRFWCPGCRTHHWFRTEAPAQPDGSGVWTWNGDVEMPTVTPSIVAPATHCHLFIDHGKLRFLDDCQHALAGKTVPMEDVD